MQVRTKRRLGLTCLDTVYVTGWLPATRDIACMRASVASHYMCPWPSLSRPRSMGWLHYVLSSTELTCLLLAIIFMNAAGNAFGPVCLSVSVSVPLVLLKNDLETLFWVCEYIFRISRSSSYIEVTGSRSRTYDCN